MNKSIFKKMKKFCKQNFVLILAFLLPISFIVIVFLVIYLPPLFLSTNYNFIYSACSQETNPRLCHDYLDSRYSVVNSKLELNDIDPTLVTDLYDDRALLDADKQYKTHLFLHDTEKNESREITEEEARTLKLSALLTSPDGLTVSKGFSGSADFLFFESGYSYNHYLVKGSHKKKLNLIKVHNSYYGSNNLRFIGWVLPGREQ